MPSHGTVRRTCGSLSRGSCTAGELDKMSPARRAGVWVSWYSAEAQKVAESYMEVGDKGRFRSITLDGQPLDMSQSAARLREKCIG